MKDVIASKTSPSGNVCGAEQVLVAFCVAGLQRSFLENYDSMGKHLISPFNAAPDSRIFLFIKNATKEAAKGVDSLKTHHEVVATLTPETGFLHGRPRRLDPGCFPDRWQSTDYYTQAAHVWWNMNFTLATVEKWEVEHHRRFDMLVYTRPDVRFVSDFGPWCLYDRNLWYKDLTDHLWVMPRKYARVLTMLPFAVDCKPNEPCCTKALACKAFSFCPQIFFDDVPQSNALGGYAITQSKGGGQLKIIGGSGLKDSESKCKKWLSDDRTSYLGMSEHSDDSISLKVTSRKSSTDRSMNAYNRHLDAIALLTSSPLPSLAEMIGRRTQRALELGCGEGLATVELLSNLERLSPRPPCVAGLTSYVHALRTTYKGNETAAAIARAAGKVVAGNVSRAALMQSAKHHGMAIPRGTPFIADQYDFRTGFPYKSGTFDFVYSNNAVAKLQYVEGELQPILWESLRVLRLGGTSIMQLVPSGGIKQFASARVPAFANKRLQNADMSKMSDADLGWIRRSQDKYHLPLEIAVGHVHPVPECLDCPCAEHAEFIPKHIGEPLSDHASSDSHSHCAMVYLYAHRSGVASETSSNLNMVIHKFDIKGARSCAAALQSVDHFGKMISELEGSFVPEDGTVYADLDLHAKTLDARMKEVLKKNSSDDHDIFGVKDASRLSAASMARDEAFILAVRKWLRQALKHPKFHMRVHS